MKNNLSEQQQRVKDLQTVLEKFIITAPADGMIIYKRDRMGTKRKVGSSISPWDNVVATLPDMSSMVSKTYVNEIDVSKVKPGQQVEIVVDAFPEKQYTGQVTSVANIGEQLPNADAKVFEVVIAVNESDPILRPSMTTGNKIITKTIDDVTYIPLESVQTGADSIPFIYLKNGDKQIVVLGEANENNIIVEQGVEAGTLMYLNTPENPESFELTGEDLIATIKERERIRKEEEEKAKQAQRMEMSFPGGRGGFGEQGGFTGRRGGQQGAVPGGDQVIVQQNPGQAGNATVQNGQRGQGGFSGGQRPNLTPEMRAQFQKLRESGDTAAMRQLMRNMRQQSGQQGGTQTQRQAGDTTRRRRVVVQEQPQTSPANN
jgi:hypothetical protein